MLRLALIACILYSIIGTAVGLESKKVDSSGAQSNKDGDHPHTELITLYLIVDYHTNNIFFIGQIVGLIGCEAYVLRKNATEPELVPGLGNGRKAIAIDQTNGIVYIAAENGIYVYDDATKTSKKLDYTASIPHDIIYMDIANGGKTLYYVNAETKKIHKISIERKTPPEDVLFFNDASELTIDQQDNFYYTHNNVPYVVKAGQTKSLQIKENGREIKVQDITEDKDGHVLVINVEGYISKINADKAEATKIGKANLPGDATSFTVEANGDLLIGYKYGLLRIKKA